VLAARRIAGCTAAIGVVDGDLAAGLGKMTVDAIAEIYALRPGIEFVDEIGGPRVL
jgi:hypothetical protein